MSYSITLRVYQRNPGRGFFHIVEKTVNYANGGTRSEANGTLTLTIGGDGTSGVLLFLSDKGERITLAVGVHNYKRWCDVATGLNPDETSLVINGQYYNDGGRDWVRVRQQTEHSATSPTGTTVKVIYTVAEGNKLEANVIIE